MSSFWIIFWGESKMGAQYLNWCESFSDIYFPLFPLPNLKEKSCFLWNDHNTWFYLAETMETETFLYSERKALVTLGVQIWSEDIELWTVLFLKKTVFWGIWYT